MVPANGVNKERDFIAIQYSEGRPPKGLNVFNWVKVTGIIITIILALGGVVWTAAMLSANSATKKEVDVVEDRIELVEKNDIAQTIILKNIKESVDEIKRKLEKALEK